MSSDRPGHARTLRGLGLADFELRDYVACVQHLDAALRSNVRPLEHELRTETEALRARAAGFVGRLTLRAQPEASRLLVDGAQADWPVAPLLFKPRACVLPAQTQTTARPDRTCQRWY